jgi:DNA-binding transcriptional LysR family regulator
MNIHHLELFYYVARHGGVSAAARHMPYGIQQPAVSTQMMQLEETLGTALFVRRPFQLTEDGMALYEFIAPFFARLEEMSQQIGNGAGKRLRIAAPEIVQREYLPAQLQRMRRRVPGFQFKLTPGRQREIEALLQAREIDLGVGILSDAPAAGLRHRELVKLDLVLLVPEDSGIGCAADVLEADRIEQALITLGAKEGVSRAFQAELRQRGVYWEPSLEMSGLDLVARYVAEGFGIGLSLHLPHVRLPAGVRELMLPGFAPVSFVAMWTGKLSPLGEAFVEEAEALAAALFGPHMLPKGVAANAESRRE